MNKFLYCIYDTKSGQHGVPFVMESDESAKRSFLDSLSEVRSPSMLSKFPSDFELRKLGEYDSFSGHIISSEPEFIANASTFGAKLPKLIEKRKKLYAEEYVVNALEEKYSMLADETFRKVYSREIEVLKANE